MQSIMKLTLFFLFALLCLNYVVTEVDARRKKHVSAVSDKSLFNLFGSSKNSESPKTLNCFSVQSGLAALIDNYITKEANGTKSLKVKFYLTSRDKPDRVTLKKGKNFNLDNVIFDVKKRTVVIVHGFMSSGDETWMKDMASAFLQWGNVNVIVVDWSDGASTYNYLKAAVNTKTVGDEIATFFGRVIGKKSNSVTEGSWGTLHFVGHSLGAHIVGYAARQMRKRDFKWNVSRVTGLDPAQPCFQNADKELRLDDTVAPFVDVIHTNGKELTKFGLGMSEQVGHIDFYPNGGENQPSCIKSNESRLLNFLKKFLPKSWVYLKPRIEKMICSHGMSYLYFTDSLKRASDVGCILLAFRWNRSWDSLPSSLNPLTVCKDRDCVEMGIQAEMFADEFNGTFFTITGKESPYCKFDDDSKAKLEILVKKAKSIVDSSE